MNADHSAQLRLLDLQAADTAIAQLSHRRRTLSELGSLVKCELRAATLYDESIDAETEVADIADEQRRLEQEVDTVRARAARDEQRLLAGGLPSKELEGLQHELTTLARRQSTLEDELLDVMERREASESALAALTSQRAALDAERAELEGARDAAFREIDAAVSQRASERGAVAEEIPDDLLALYERAREHGGGVGASMLRYRRCEGCHIELSGSEVSSLRSAAADVVVRCANCRRILVRTAESGL